MSESSRYEKGADIIGTYQPEAWEALQENLADIAPDLARFVAEWAFGDIYSRPGLDLKRRQLLTLACLTTLGGTEKQIQAHVSSALKLGLQPIEIVEAVLHCLPYVSFPRTLNAMMAVRVALESEGCLPVKST